MIIDERLLKKAARDYGEVFDEKTDLKVQAKSFLGGVNKEVSSDWTGYLLKKHS